MKSIRRIYRFQLAYAERLVEDVPEKWMARPAGAGLENHPAFTLGHLISGTSLAAGMLGVEASMPDGWREIFERKGPGDPRMPAETEYPSKAELLAELARQHRLLDDALAAAGPEKLAEPCEWRFCGWLPTVGDCLAFLCTWHEANHLGQLAAWRRAMNLPSALGAMDRGA